MELEVISSTFSLGPQLCSSWRKKSIWEYSEICRPRHPKNWLNTFEFALPAVGVCHMVIWEAYWEMEELWNWVWLLQLCTPACAGLQVFCRGEVKSPKLKTGWLILNRLALPWSISCSAPQKVQPKDSHFTGSSEKWEDGKNSIKYEQK